MALDGLNQLGKYLNKTRKAIDKTLTRYNPHYPNIERSRDIFDRENSYQFIFRTKKTNRTFLFLDFDVPPILSDCKAGCIHAGCKSIAVTAGTNSLNLGESYKVGTLSAFLGETILAASAINESNPSAGDVVVTSGTGQLTICYVHDECSAFPCNGIRENCTTVAQNIITFTSSSNTVGPFSLNVNGDVFISALSALSAYKIYTTNLESGTLAFPGVPQLWYASTGAQINRLTPFLNAQSVDVYISQMPSPYGFDSFAEVGMGIAYNTSTDFHDSGRTVFPIFEGVTTRMSEDFPTGVPYIFQKIGDYFEPSLTGGGTYQVVVPKTVAKSTDSIQAVANALLMRTAGVSDWGVKLPYAAGATWNRSEMLLKWDFSLNDMTGSNYVRFGAGNVYVDINTDGTITLYSSIAAQSYTKILTAGTTYTLDIMYDLHQSRAQARVYPLGNPAPAWEVSVATAGEYAGGPGYQPAMFWEIHNVSGNTFILSLSKIYTTFSAIPNGSGTFPPSSDVINLNQIVTATNVGLGDTNTTFKKQWHTDGHGFNYFVLFEEEAHDWIGPTGPQHIFGQVGSPHAFGIAFGNGDIEYIHQQTGSVVLPYFRNHSGLPDAWLDYYYIRVTGEYRFATTGASNELSDTGHSVASMFGSFQTFNFGDTETTNATDYYILGGGDELYAQHNVSLETQGTSWIPFSFRAHNEGTNGGISFGTGNGVAVDQVIFQWGVKIWNDPYEIRDTIGSIKNTGFVGAPGRGEISFSVRNVVLELVKHDGGIIIPIPECTYECV